MPVTASVCCSYSHPLFILVRGGVSRCVEREEEEGEERREKRRRGRDRGRGRG